jgi:hypothetical protein
MATDAVGWGDHASERARAGRWKDGSVAGCRDVEANFRDADKRHYHAAAIGPHSYTRGADSKTVPASLTQSISR